MKKDLILRPVTSEDVDILFKWANDPVVRASAYSTEPIDYKTHVKWFKKKLEDENCCIYILTDGEEAFGQVRGDIEGDRTEIDYSISAAFRGQGMAKEMLSLFESKISSSLLYAEVKKENIASQKVFEALGYRKKENTDIFIYEKTLNKE